MSIFKKNKAAKPFASYTYTQSDDRSGFRRVKLSSYGHKPAENGIRALAGSDLSLKVIKVDIYKDAYPRAVFSIGRHELGTIWDRYDCFKPIAKGQARAMRIEIDSGDAFLYYLI